jgi:hypothetical protein
VDKLLKVVLPVTPKVVPIVALLLIESAFTVALPLDTTVVKNAVLGVAFPIGVFWIPPLAVNDPALALKDNLVVLTFGC